MVRLWEGGRRQESAGGTGRGRVTGVPRPDRVVLPICFLGQVLTPWPSPETAVVPPSPCVFPNPEHIPSDPTLQPSPNLPASSSLTLKIFLSSGDGLRGPRALPGWPSWSLILQGPRNTTENCRKCSPDHLGAYWEFLHQKKTEKINDIYTCA